MKSLSKSFPSRLACLTLFISAALLLHALPPPPSSAFGANSSLRSLSALRVSALSFSSSLSFAPLNSQASANHPHSYLGFDRNVYPGDVALPVLRKTFSFTSYWLSPPPGEKTNTWKGKRDLLRSYGFGFAVLFRGRTGRELKNETDAIRLATLDAQNAAVAARTEGFPQGTIIFLDIEEGGRLPAIYHAYVRAWAARLFRESYRPAVYCSGMPVDEGNGVAITTADDIRNHAASKQISFWVFNDACPPSPGCTFPQAPPPPSASHIKFASVWQFAQSPHRKEFTAHCPPGYHSDGNCYARGDAAHAWFLDLNSAISPDPSGGTRQK